MAYPFLNPDETFLRNERQDSSSIFVFINWHDIENRYCEVFKHLEYYRLARENEPLTLNDLSYIPLENIKYAMYGLHLSYTDENRLGQSFPLIWMAHIVFLCTKNETLYPVENISDNAFQLSSDMTDISTHLKSVDETASKFLSQINNKLNFSIRIISLEEYYSTDEKFNFFPPVQQYKNKRDNFVIVTGKQCHYLFDKNINGSYYEHNTDDVLHRQNVGRSLCNCTGYYHCNHPEVMQIKSRPQQDGKALCKIWLFEQELCCRACIFEKICRKNPTFLLPCDTSNTIIPNPQKGDHYEQHVSPPY